MIRDVPSKSNK
jgi:hypothetical protein